jgi:hypothetical protein
LLQRLFGHGAQRTQGIFLRNSLLTIHIQEHIQLLLVFSAHAFFLADRAVETRGFLVLELASVRRVEIQHSDGSTRRQLAVNI